MNLFSTRANRNSVERLRKLDVFRKLTFKEALEMDELLHERVYERDEIIFEEGDLGHGIFIVVSGKVRADPSHELLKTGVKVLVELSSTMCRRTRHLLLRERHLPSL